MPSTFFMAQVFWPTFVAPGLAVAGLVAISVPIIIHLIWRRPRRPEPWAAMRFLLAAHQRHRLRSQMEQWLLLLLRASILALLGLALAGPLLEALGLGRWAESGRNVVIVLDNSLTSGATEASGRSRLESLKSSALEILAGLKPNDRAALILASAQAQAVVAPAVGDLSVVRAAIERTQPAYSSPDWSGGLRLALEETRRDQNPSARTEVILLSDFSAGALGSVPPTLPEELKALGPLSRLWMSEPAAPVANIQVAQLDPDHRLVIPESPGVPPSVTWNVRLRRFSPDLPQAQSKLRLEMAGAASRVAVISWAQGQQEAEVVLETELAESGPAAAVARLEESAGADGLASDNERWGLVHLRSKLLILLLDRNEPSDDPSRFTPRRWLQTALVPVSDRLAWPVEVRVQDPQALSTQAGESLRDADAVLVLRPDLLEPSGWEALVNWAQAGGLAWFMPPADSSETLWGLRLTQSTGLPWSFQGRVVQEAPALRLATDAPAVGELERLGSQWADLLRPVVFQKHIGIEPAGLTGQTQILLMGRGSDGEVPLLIGAATTQGRGRILLLGAAVDGSWTNLSTKPLFVAMLHEVLRSAVGRLQRPGEFLPGQRPRLEGPWIGQSRLTGPDGQEVLLVDEPNRDSALVEAPTAVIPTAGLKLPGLYRGSSEILAVNVGADGANTLACDPTRLKAWLSTAGQWRELPEGGILHLKEDQPAQVGWPILWLVLALAIFEVFWARHVSRAGIRQGTATHVLAQPIGGGR